MTKWQRILLSFVRHWPFPFKGRLAKLLAPHLRNKKASFEGVVMLKPNLLFHVNTNSYIEYKAYSEGDYEPEIGRLIYTFAREGYTVLDVGANVGIHTLRMADAVGAAGTVLAFEPISYLAARLKNNLGINRLNNVIVVPCALADEEKELPVTVHEGLYNQGIFSLAGAGAGNVMIKVRRGDTIVEEMQLNRVDFIKIDVEGYEWNVLMGLASTIQKHKPVIIFEFDKNFPSVSIDVKIAMHDFFVQNGYSLYVIDGELLFPLISLDLAPDSGNILALPFAYKN